MTHFLRIDFRKRNEVQNYPMVLTFVENFLDFGCIEKGTKKRSDSTQTRALIFGEYCGCIEKAKNKN